MWQAFVEIIRASIFATAHLCGGSLGGGIVVTSVLVRLALLPLSLRMARRARDQQQRLTAIAGEVERLQRRFAKDPAKLLVATHQLHREHGIRTFTPSTVLTYLVQAPFLAGLFGAVRSGLGQRVRFAWIADLGRSNVGLVLLVTALSALAAIFQPVAPAPATRSGQVPLAVLVTAVSTCFFLWSASSAVALSWGGGALVTVLQNVLLARDARRAPGSDARRAVATR